MEGVANSLKMSFVEFLLSIRRQLGVQLVFPVNPIRCAGPHNSLFSRIFSVTVAHSPDKLVSQSPTPAIRLCGRLFLFFPIIFAPLDSLASSPSRHQSNRPFGNYSSLPQLSPTAFITQHHPEAGVLQAGMTQARTLSKWHQQKLGRAMRKLEKKTFQISRKPSAPTTTIPTSQKSRNPHFCPILPDSLPTWSEPNRPAWSYFFVRPSSIGYVLWCTGVLMSRPHFVWL